VSDLGPQINAKILEEVFSEKCIEVGTSLPENIRFIEALRLAYIIFPSVQACTKIFDVKFYEYSHKEAKST
jgi:hypothetical protein